MRSKASYLAICLLLAGTLACNLSTPQGLPESPPVVMTIVATATAPEPSEAAPESDITEESTPVAQASPTTVTSPGSSSLPGTGGGDLFTNGDGDVFDSVSIKNGSGTYEGKISFPGNDTSDDIYVKPTGFDSDKKSGNLIFTLTCSGRGKAKVNYKGGKVENGEPGCGETWTIYVINGSPDSQITIRLDSSGEVSWSLMVTSSE